jgi:low affinity Fe/Cu permease
LQEPHEEEWQKEEPLSVQILSRFWHFVCSYISDRDSRYVMKIEFCRFCQVVSKVVGSTWAFVFAILSVIVWALLGPQFDYSDTWQLVINTSTTIVTFLMVFLIQNSQNRDSKAMQLKLDELIRSIHGARNEMIDLENLSENERKVFEEEFQKLQERFHSKQK